MKSGSIRNRIRKEGRNKTEKKKELKKQQSRKL
jgi:hypothetical protein